MTLDDAAANAKRLAVAPDDDQRNFVVNLVCWKLGIRKAVVHAPEGLPGPTIASLRRQADTLYAAALRWLG